MRAINMATFKRLSKRETFKLIELVQQNTPIYDICSENYKDRVLLGNMFDKISRQLEINRMTCKLKIYLLFNIYRIGEFMLYSTHTEHFNMKLYGRSFTFIYVLRP